ncbi:MAG: TonB-dependent receptor [Pseudomonadota bacterium]
MLSAGQGIAQDATEAEQLVTVDVITVTGEKIERDLQDTVTSVGIVTGDQLSNDGIVTLGDAFDYIANVNLNASEQGFSIRGIPFDNLLGAGSSPLAQIYVDDVTLGDQTTRFNADTIWDIAQVEVLRGAQSTVQGRNALAGAVIIRTNNPSYEPEGQLRILGTTWDGGDAYTIGAAYGGPIIDDQLAFRVSAERRESDGFVSNPVRGEDGADFNDQWQLRGKLLWDITPDISSLLTVAWSQAKVADAVSDRRSRDANGFVNLTEVEPGNESNRQAFNNVADFNENTNFMASLKTDWTVSEAWTLTSITAFSDAENDEEIDTDGTNLNPAIFPQNPFEIQNPFNIPDIPSGTITFEPQGTQLEEQSIFTQEFIASYDAGGPWRGLAGAYYARSEEREFNYTPGIQAGILGVVEGATRPGVEATLRAELGPLRGIPAPGNPVAGIPADASGDAFFDAFIAGATDATVGVILANYSDIGSFLALTSEPLDVTNYAFYASGEYDLTNKLTVGLGLRYDNEDQTEGLTLSGFPLGIPDPAAPFIPPGFEPALVPVVQGSLVLVNGFFDSNLAEASTSADQSFEAWLPSGFVRYDIDEDRSVSFSVRRGYRAGGSDLNIPRQFVSQFDPEYTLNYELGLRSYWFDRALRVNANLFYTDWTDQQVVVALSTLQQDEVGFNVGESTLMGFEIDSYWQIDANWSLQGAIGYTDTEFEDFDQALAETLIAAQNQTAPIDLEQTLAAFEGQEFSFAPAWSGAARLSYVGDNGLFGTLGITYQGESFVNNANSAAGTFLNNDSRTLVNLTLGYDFDFSSVSLIVRNALDEEYVSSGGNQQVRLGAPRTIGLQVQRTF